MNIVIIRPEFRCDDCEGTDAPLYTSPRDDGYNVQAVHACEHMIRAWYPDAPEDLAPYGINGRNDITDGTR
jgi:hypothetical protein